MMVASTVAVCPHMRARQFGMSDCLTNNAERPTNEIVAVQLWGRQALNAIHVQTSVSSLEPDLFDLVVR